VTLKIVMANAATACIAPMYRAPELQEKIYAYSLNFNDDFFAPRDRRGVIHPKMEGQDA